MNNIIDKAEYTCSGCGACHAVCPVKAIKLKKDDYGLTHKSLITYRDELQKKDGELTDTVCLYCDCIVGYIDDGADLKYRIRLVRTRGDYSE